MVHGISSVSTLSHPDLHVTRTQAEVNPRRISKILGAGPNTTLGVHNGDINTLERALLERMYFCKVGTGFSPAPNPTYRYIDQKLGYFRNAIANFSVKPVSTTEVVDMYKGRKRTIYAQAEEEYDRRGVRRDDARINAFVKVEKVNTDKAPRCIQPRSPVYNLKLGTYIKPIEHRLYRKIACMFENKPVVMKGFTTEEVAAHILDKWNSFHEPVAVGLDATKFDMHVSEGMLRWEHSIYQRVYGNPAELRTLLKWQRNNEGRGRTEDGKLTYKVRGKRASGDMNTALGNCLIMCACVHAYAKERGVHIDLANNGDDCVVFMERCDLEKFSVNLDEWFLCLGFRMTKEEPVYDVRGIEFCQMHPVRGGNGWNMVRNIPTALQKDTLCTIPLDGPLARKWMYAVGECGLALCAGVPVMQDFYEAYMRNGNPDSNIHLAPQMVTGLSMMRGGLESRSRRISDQAREDVFVAWGITPDEQVSLERHYQQWTFTEPGDTEIFDFVPTLFNVI